MLRSMPSYAMVLAAGFGKRMRPITDTLPKPLVEVDGITMLDRALEHLRKAGVSQAVVNTHYLAPLVQKHLEGRKAKHPKPKLMISHEPEILETGGGVLKALSIFGTQPFFVINSDIVWLDKEHELLLKRMAERWNDQTMDMLIALIPVRRAIGYDGNGDFLLAGTTVMRPDGSDPLPYVYMGVMLVHPRIFKQELPPPPFSMNVFFQHARQSNGTLSRVCGIEHTGDWLHIGTPEGLEKAEEFLQGQK